MKKLIYLIVLTFILGLVLAGCTLLSNIGQVPSSEQSGITYLTKGLPFSDGLVGLWSFEEGEDSTIAYDSSGNNNDGTINGAIYNPDQWGGQALSFNGVDKYVSVPDSTSLDISDEITVEAWIKVAVHKNFNAIVIKGEDGAENYELLLYADGRVHCPIKFTDSSRTYLNAGLAITDTEWHHVAMTYKPGEWRIYVDGVEKAERTDISKTPLTNDVPLFIGAEQYLGLFRAERFFNGLIDEVRIYDCALSPGTIEAHAAGIYGFNGLLAPYAPPEQKAFKAGSTIPLKWQYTDSAGPVDSENASPVVGWIFMGPPVNGSDILEEEDAPGASGLRYDALTMTWQFNWQTTKSFTPGQYDIYIKINQTGQTDGPFPIWLK